LPTGLSPTGVVTVIPQIKAQINGSAVPTLHVKGAAREGDAWDV